MRARARLAVSVTVLALAACGIPVEEDSRPLPADDAPSSPPGPTSGSAPSAGESRHVPVDVFFVRGSRLAPVSRPMPPPPSVEGAIVALLREPKPAERSEGLRTALTRPVRLAGTLSAGVPLVDVTETFDQTEGEEQILALAQLVFTLTGLPGVEGVSFALEGRPVEVPTGDGTLKRGPLRREDFAAVAPE